MFLEHRDGRPTRFQVQGKVRALILERAREPAPVHFREQVPFPTRERLQEQDRQPRRAASWERRPEALPLPVPRKIHLWLIRFQVLPYPGD